MHANQTWTLRCKWAVSHSIHIIMYTIQTWTHMCKRAVSHSIHIIMYAIQTWTLGCKRTVSHSVHIVMQATQTWTQGCKRAVPHSMYNFSYMHFRLGPMATEKLCPTKWSGRLFNSDWDYGYKRAVSHKVIDVCDSDWDPWLQKSCVPQNEVIDACNSDLDPVVQKSCVLQNEVTDVCNSDCDPWLQKSYVPQCTNKYTTLVDIKNMRYKKLFTHIESHVSAVSLLESGE